MILRSRMLARWVGWAGLVASVLYLFNQGDILATAVPGFPVFDLAGFIGSSLWADLADRPGRGRAASSDPPPRARGYQPGHPAPSNPWS